MSRTGQRVLTIAIVLAVVVIALFLKEQLSNAGLNRTEVEVTTDVFGNVHINEKNE